jgi:transposase
MIPVGAKQTDLEKMDPRTLSAMVAGCLTHIEHLESMIAQLRRLHFGRRSEKANGNDQQIGLALDGSVAPADEPGQQKQPEATAPNRPACASRKSRALPKHLKRETRTHLPEQENCPGCGGAMKKLGEDVSEMLEYVPESFIVIRHVRPKLTCSRCSSVVQAPAPSRPVDRGLPGPGLLAHVLTAKFADHLPPCRQSQMYAREGVELDRSVLARWVGEASELMAPLVEVLRRYVMSTEKLHGDDTPLPVLAPGHGRTKTARFWTYVRDGRPAGDTAAPAVWFSYSPDRKGEHPQRHLARFRGILQADAYSGFKKLYEDGAIQEAPCMAHIRRKFFELMDAYQLPIATEAVERIAALYRIEKEIKGRSADQRRAVRAARARPLDNTTERATTGQTAC